MIQFIIEHIAAIGTGIGAVITTIITTLVAVRKSNKERIETTVKLALEERKAELEEAEAGNKHLLTAMQLYQKDNKELRADVDELKKKTEELEGHLLNEKTLRLKMQVQLSVYMQAHLSMPLPMWVKDKEFRMVSVNKPYWRVFLKPKGIDMHEYSGRNDSEIWGNEVGTLFNRHDRLAKKNGFWVGRERITVEGADWTEDWVFVKYRLEENDDFVGIGGVAIPNFTGESDPVEILEKYSVI